MGIGEASDFQANGAQNLGDDKTVRAHDSAQRHTGATIRPEANGPADSGRRVGRALGASNEPTLATVALGATVRTSNRVSLPRCSDQLIVYQLTCPEAVKRPTIITAPRTTAAPSPAKSARFSKRSSL